MATDKTARTVSFDGQALRLDTAADAEEICQQLASHADSCEILILQGNTFNIEAAERVGHELEKHPELREAHFKDLFTSRGREIVPDALGHLLRGIANSGAQLTLLDLSDNAIGPIGAPTVVEFLESSAAETIQKFYIHNCGMGPEGSSTLAAYLYKLSHLQEFICGRNRLENKGAANVSAALSQISSLRLLKLNQNGIQVQGIAKLVEALEANIDTVEEFDFSDNTIKSEGSKALAKFLLKARNLRRIRLDDDLLENAGFAIICDALSKSPSSATLEEVTFEGNELSGQKTIDLIFSTFGNYSRNFTLNLLENEFSPAGLLRLKSLSRRFNIYIDDLDEDDDDDDDSDDASENASEERGSDQYEDDEDNYNESEDRQQRGSQLEEGEIAGSSGTDESGCSSNNYMNGYVNIADISNEIREIVQDFIKATTKQPFDSQLVNESFLQLVTAGLRSDNDPSIYKAVQVVCEELGLMKLEETRKKKPLASDAIVYIGKHKDSLPKAFREFFAAVVANSDELSDCGKLLFTKLEI